MALKNFTQFTPQTILSATDFLVGYRDLDEIRTDLSSLTDAISGLLISKGFTPGGTVGSVKRIGYRYTIGTTSPVNAVSGADDFGLVLAYNSNVLEVYRNGSHLVESLDYLAPNGTQITNLSTLNVGDIVEVVALSGTTVTFAPVISGSGNAFLRSFRYTVNTGNTIVPNATFISGSDDYGVSLAFIPPNLEVYLNGAHLIRDIDYGLYSSGTSLTLNDPVTGGDVLDVIGLSAYNMTVTGGLTAYSNVTNINRGKNILISQTSGVVTISAKSDICSEISLDDVPVPGWTDGQHITRWSLLQDYLSAVAATNTSPASAIYGERFGSVPSGFGALSLTIAPNGKIYAFGGNAGGGNTWVVVIDPNTNTVSSFGMPFNTTDGGIAQGVLAPNGKIYAVPYVDTIVRVIDPSTNTISSIGTLIKQFGVQAIGAVLAPNGRIYTIPYNSSMIQVIDPNSNTIASFGTISGTASSLANQPQYFNNAVLGRNGKIYCMPDLASHFWVIDPSNNTVTSIASTPFLNVSGGAYSKGVVAINGKIYTGPGSSRNIYAIDPSSDTLSAVTSVNFSGYNMILYPNGKIYMDGDFSSATFFAILDPDNNTITTVSVPLFSGYQSAFGCVVHPNGKVYYGNNNATQFLAITPLNKNNWNLNVCTNPLIGNGGPSG